jgi:hypothetical protein
VEKVTYTPSVPGLDIPYQVRERSTAATHDVATITTHPEPTPLSLRQHDHAGTNAVLSPDVRTPIELDDWAWY